MKIHFLAPVKRALLDLQLAAPCIVLGELGDPAALQAHRLLHPVYLLAPRRSITPPHNQPHAHNAQEQKYEQLAVSTAVCVFLREGPRE